ncbi:hypothetical protein LguiB_003608 [Lonicera macranthoides]
MAAIFSPYYNPLQFNSSDLFSIKSAQSASSSSDNTSILHTANVSDEEEVMLASSHPKKRAGRIKFMETRHPVYRGVRKRNSGKWVCEVRQPNKKSRIWLGTYPSADMAARAHDVAAIALRGRTACLNFADSTWRLPIPASSDVKDIQRAAAEAAEIFRSPESDVVFENDLVEEIATSLLPENGFYTDDESVFGLEEVLANMAEGLMLPSPHCGEDGYGKDDMEISADMFLWSYSL